VGRSLANGFQGRAAMQNGVALQHSFIRQIDRDALIAARHATISDAQVQVREPTRRVCARGSNATLMERLRTGAVKSAQAMMVAAGKDLRNGQHDPPTDGSEFGGG
jgi:hypothetical protein